MKQTYILPILFFLLLSHSVCAQIQIQNGGMELWSGFNPERPDNWSTTEQAFGLKNNKWVFKETRPDNVHSGTTSVRLYSDTVITTYGGKPGQTRMWPGIIAYGKAGYTNSRITTSGLPIYGRPISLSFYIKVYHPQPDTASMRLVLTRWNPQRRQADTLAYEKFDILPDSTIMGGFTLFVDSINYQMSGEADTARLIISGGRPGNIRLRGNMVWIDDLSFNYPGSQIVHPDIEDNIFLYPNPATTRINIKANSDLFGYSVIFLDVTGVKVKETTIDDGTTSIDLADMRDGSYCYAVLDRDKNKVLEGNINVMRNR